MNWFTFLRDLHGNESMGKLVGIVTGRQVRKGVIDSRINFSITQARDWVRLHWTGGQRGTEEKRMDSRCIL